MSDVLLVYASHFGQTRIVAERIAKRLRSHGHDVDVVDLGDRKGAPRARGYDMVIVGSRVELGKHARAVHGFVRENHEDLRDIPTAFFSVSMSASRPGAGNDPGDYMEKTFAALGWRPTEFTAFAGGVPYRRYGAFLRFVMKRINRTQGYTIDTSRDHVFTNEAEVDAFAERLARLLGTYETHASA